MSQTTAIEWTEATLNPWTGCTKVSPGCAHCYIARTPPFRMADRVFVGGHIPLVFHMDRLDRMIRRRKPTMYFVNSLSDLFHEDASDDQIVRVFAAMAAAPQHTFQILTKRPERMRDWFAWEGKSINRCGTVRNEFDWHFAKGCLPIARLFPWPLPNVWLGVSIENRRFVHRADVLRETPAAVRFISAEPLLGPLLPDDGEGGWEDDYEGHGLYLNGIDWLIVGGESGPHHRPIHTEWVRALRDATRLWHEDETTQLPGRHCAFFFKQWGGARPTSGGRLLDGRTWDEMPRGGA